MRATFRIHRRWSAPSVNLSLVNLSLVNLSLTGWRTVAIASEEHPKSVFG